MQRIIINSIISAFLLIVVLAFGWTIALSSPAIAHLAESDEEQQILQAYRGFADAQNRRDLAAIGAFFIDGPEFLWVSDGQSYWGRDAVLARMGSFQKAEIWRVLPGLDQATVLMMDDGAGLLHMPLVLEIGKAAAPDRLHFLVSILFRRVGERWLIAALLTTNDKTPR